MSKNCWFLPTDDSLDIGPWVGPVTMYQGRSKPSLVNFQDKVCFDQSNLMFANYAYFLSYNLYLIK